MFELLEIIKCTTMSQQRNHGHPEPNYVCYRQPIRDIVFKDSDVVQKYYIEVLSLPPLMYLCLTYMNTYT